MRTPFAEALRRAMESRSSEICTALPARVETYDAAEQRCSVQPLIRHVYRGEDGARQTERLPVITDVPVVFPGAGAYSITFPLAKGDIVLLVFSQASIDKWLTTGKEVDPLDERRHSLNDAIAIPGLRSFGGKAGAGPIPAAGVVADTLVIRAPEIHAGGSQELALKSDVDDLANWIRTTMVVNATGATAGTTNTPPSADGTTVLKGG